MDMEPSLYSIDSWQYLQEGNENIVFSYIGSSLKYRNFVLRLPKCIPGAPSRENPAEAKASRQKLFYELVVCPLLGKQYLQEKISIPVGSEFLSKLNSEALKVRPATRRHKHIDTNIQQMTLTTNLLRMSGSSGTFSVEIKPKWGFLPTWKHLPPESPKLSNCRFCMHQKLKAIEDGKVPSRFCPLLLFASDPLKKYRAVQQLFETPQNNLRCFLDGIETDPGTASQEVSKEFDSQDEFLLQKMLASVLAQDGVLNRIKALQQDFDLYDVEGIYKMLETMDKSAISEANEQQWKELIQSYLKGLLLSGY
ncbi:hypothetical protein DSO57_1015845 [Entomophthora muscae]|uniref:Uncharacterized protein n=1 Tax=Entomophthora muscae TaxID=34485 RepID=A0ACC2UEU7_9FUNG|nr:hypothetical protein DSO57_1015845 [Entomophthora muscae]